MKNKEENTGEMAVRSSLSYWHQLRNPKLKNSIDLPSTQPNLSTESNSSPI